MAPLPLWLDYIIPNTMSYFIYFLFFNMYCLFFFFFKIFYLLVCHFTSTWGTREYLLTLQDAVQLSSPF